MIELLLNQILQGDVLQRLEELPDECIDCVVTSPPYYGLRDYGITGQIGLEKTLEEYLDKMLLITAELKRVLKKTGTMWWNHGDSYSTRHNSGTTDAKTGRKAGKLWQGNGRKQAGRAFGGDITDKCLMLQNFRLAQRMVDEQQWILRNVLVWWKPNCMPSSAKDRFTVDFEPMFFLTKSKRYYFEPQYEAHTDLKGFQKRIKSKFGSVTKTKGLSGSAGTQEGGFNDYLANKEVTINPLGRNKRSVWKIPTSPYREAHFATFPLELIETPIKAGCPEKICKKCGKAREVILETTRLETTQTRDDGGQRNFNGERWISETKKNGYTDCHCNAGWNKGIVLDPFAGSGTTALVARQLGRDFIVIELNPNYIKLAEKRLAQQVLL